MKSQRIGYTPSKTSFNAPQKSKGYVLENVIIGVLGIAFGGVVAYGANKVANVLIEDYRDHKTSTLHNSAGVVTDKDRSGGYFSPIMVSDGRGGFTTIQQYVPESFYLEVASDDVDRPFTMEVHEQTYNNTYVGQIINYHYRVGGNSHKVIGTYYGHVETPQPKIKM